MLRFAQHDKTEDVIPNAVRNPVWMLRFAQHDSRVVIPHALFCHSERMRGIQYGCFASLSMTAVWSFRTLFFVIPSACEESSMDASLRSA
jgi:hypothetical protein